jgi:molecular chaperone DnaK
VAGFSVFMTRQRKRYAIGIDLGTTNSCIAATDGKNVTVIPNRRGERVTPSCIAFLEDGHCVVGHAARRKAAINPGRTVAAVKRVMGRKYNTNEVQRILASGSLRIAAAPNGDAHVLVGERAYSPPELMAIILRELKADAEAHLQDTVDEIVICVPANFDANQRQATKDAAFMAGMNVQRVLNEPTAAALAYGLGKAKEPRTVAVYDLGGGTFDISILSVQDGLFEVLASGGDSFLGGEDFDDRIVRHLVSQFVEEAGVDPRSDPCAVQRLKEAAEKAKHELSEATTTDIRLPFLCQDHRGPHHLNTTATRAALDSLCKDLVDRTIETCHYTLVAADAPVERIDHLILVGGMTRMPLVRKRVEEFMKRKSSGGVHPEEVVAVGAAVQAGILAGLTEEVLLMDVAPYTMGIESAGGVFTPIIRRNTLIPASESRTFSTTRDGQDVVSIHVLMGEGRWSRENRSLCRFDLVGIHPSPRGTPRIDVQFDVDVDGLVNVAARDTTTGKEHSTVLRPSSGLTPEELEEARVSLAAERRADA